MVKQLEKLEFNKIKEIIEKFAITYKGKKIIENLEPYDKKNDIKKALNETTEGVTLIYRKGLPPIYDIPDINVHIKMLESSGILNAKYLLDLANILKQSRCLKEYINSDIDVSFAENLSRYFSNLYSNANIENNIFSKILDENTIDDRASSTLYNIRKKIKSIESSIKEKLNSYMHSKYIQESVITYRNGRFVIPVKNEYRSEIKGFIHDISASGSTVFIEPVSVFELNNEINNLKNEEKIEIEIILQKLSADFFGIIEEIKNDVNLIGIIDFIFAKSKYSKSIDAVEPIINDEKYINLIGAWHPLIDRNKAVANDITIGKNYNTLVITGPNTGGKTVTLKTAGLLCLMAMSGIHIPAKEKSSIYYFDNIFADIGDEQSIINQVSTFSSHMINIVKILDKATENSLVLVDELGSGTDPIEGAALAVSILENLNNRKSLTIATTHYSEVKHFALVTKGFENASVEFDVETLSPTYRLLIGVPGTSNAFAISKKIGLSNNIIERAKGFIDKSSINIEDLLKKIYDDKRVIEEEKERIIKKSKEISELKELLSKDNSDIKIKAKEIVDKAKQQAREILIEAKEESNEIIRNIENNQNLSNANIERNKLNKKIKKLKQEDTIEQESEIQPKDIKIGDNVLILSLNQTGVVVKLPNKEGKVQIQVGSMKMNFPLSNLKIVEKEKEKKVEVKRNTSDFKVRDISTEINVIGMTVEEAIFVIDKYLDNCILTRLDHVRIVHGKGTGALRQGIHEYLKKNKNVKSYRIGTFRRRRNGSNYSRFKFIISFNLKNL